MPFTPTHVVAVLPLWPLRRWLPFPALAIGAMVPDVGLFFPIVDYAQTHSPLGVFSTCLPIGVAVFFLFENIMRRPLVALLPIWFQQRIETSPQIPTTPRLATHLFFYAGLAFAVVIGAFTHQIWDAFTHQGRWGTQLFPSLNAIVTIGGDAVPGYKLLQYGSTFFGLPLLAIFALISLRLVLPNDKKTDSVSINWKLLALLLICIVPMLVAAYAIETQASYYRALGVTIKLSGAIILVSCFVYCVGFQLFVNGDAMHYK